MLACLCWGILFVFVIVIMCCLMPWWLVLLVVVGGVLCAFFENGKNKTVHNKKRKTKKNKQKKVGKTNKSNNDAGALLAGAALAHQIRKHHKHDETKDSFREIWDDDFKDYDYQDIDDIDYDNYIADQIEEQAAYDDYIASMDMADD